VLLRGEPIDQLDERSILPQFGPIYNREPIDPAPAAIQLAWRLEPW